MLMCRWPIAVAGGLAHCCCWRVGICAPPGAYQAIHSVVDKVRRIIGTKGLAIFESSPPIARMSIDVPLDSPLKISRHIELIFWFGFGFWLGLQSQWRS